jgi:DNA-binding NarL/FixJ family response regulator
MDLEMPEYDGIEGTRMIKTEFPEIKVIILTVSVKETK